LKTAAASAGYVRENAVDGDAALLRRIETLIEKMSEEAAVLRNAFGYDRARRERWRRRNVLRRKRNREGGEAEPGNDRISDDVNIFVDAAGFDKPPLRWMERSLGREFAVYVLWRTAIRNAG